MIDWISEFSPSEWPSDCTQDMEPSLFTDCLFPLRINSGVPMTPSPLLEAHVRNKGESRHSLRGGRRKSDASDLFIGTNRQDVARVLREAFRIGQIGGFGLYPTTQLDGKRNVMIHIDHRPERLVWLRVGDDYIYEVSDPPFFYAELSRQLESLSN